jgi:uncharacterized protein (DUF697 family)
MSVPIQFKEIVRNRCIAAGASGIVIGPGLDIPILIGIWTEGTMRLATHANVDLDEDIIKRIVTAVFSGSANRLVSGLMLDVLTAAIPGVNIAVNGTVNTFYTYRYLRSISLVLNNGDNAGMIIADSGASLVLGGLSDHAPHVMARDAWELVRLFN